MFNKLKTVTYFFIITVWPAFFVVLVGYINTSISMHVTRTFDSRGIWMILLSFFVAGSIFSIHAGMSVKYYKLKSMVIANILSLFLTLFYGIYYFLSIVGYNYFGEYSRFFISNMQTKLLSFVIGYSLYSCLRIVILHIRNHSNHRDGSYG